MRDILRAGYATPEKHPGVSARAGLPPPARASFFRKRSGAHCFCQRRLRRRATGGGAYSRYPHKPAICYAYIVADAAVCVHAQTCGIDARAAKPPFHFCGFFASADFLTMEAYL